MTTRRGELARKLIHVAVSLVAAALVWWLPHPDAAVVLAGAAFVALSLELTRSLSHRFGAWFADRLGRMLRPRETHRLTGATTLAMGYTAAAVLLPGRPAVTGILVVGVADAAAALVGRRYGRRRYRGGKSVEGSAAFLGVALALVLFVSGLGAVPALAVALAATLVEAASLPVDDNFYLPLVVATLVAAAAWVAAPGQVS